MASQIVATGSVRVKITASKDSNSLYTRFQVLKNSTIIDSISVEQSPYNYVKDISVNVGDSIVVKPMADGTAIRTITTINSFTICTSKSNSILAYLGDWSLKNGIPIHAR